MSSYSHLSEDVRAALAADMTIDITTTGRKTGQPRRIEIWFLNVGGTIYITGTPGSRDWYAKLLTEPSLTFHLKESTSADLAARATAVRDRVERQRVFAAQSAAWYLNQGDDLNDLLDEAPMVRISFD